MSCGKCAFCGHACIWSESVHLYNSSSIHPPWHVRRTPHVANASAALNAAPGNTVLLSVFTLLAETRDKLIASRDQLQAASEQEQPNCPGAALQQMQVPS
jgi:hypothetical protein